MIAAVLFDLDGTLLDTAPDFYTVVNKLLAEENKPLLTRQQVQENVSNGARALIRTAFHCDVGDAAFDALLQRLLDLYAENLAIDTRCFPGIDSTLKWCKSQNIPWGIVTNKPSRFTNPIVEQLQLNPAVVICPDHVQNTKPDPEPLFLACEKLGCNASDTVYIGDHLRDIECGRDAGSITIATAYGYIAADDSAHHWGADYVVDSAEELPALLTQLLAKQNGN